MPNHPAACAWFLLALAALLFPHEAMAKLVSATLAQLVQSSDVIATGHFPAAPTHERLTTLDFRVTWLLKGGRTAVEIPVCNLDANSERPDLNEADGDYLLFLVNKGSCYALAWEYTAYVPLKDGHALTSRLEGQPTEQPIERLVKKIRSLVPGKTMVYPIQPCQTAIRLPHEVPKECVAAAVAEQAFLKETKHSASAYTIFAMPQTDAKWSFDVELGDERSPPRPGGHYTVEVARRTGAATIIPGM